MSRVGQGGMSLFTALALFGGAAATAGEPGVDKDGVMHFPNVRIVASPLISPVEAQASPGLLAFRDPDTGKFRAPTAEEAARLQQASAQQTRQSSIAQPSMFATPSGGRAMRIDESQMPYLVVSRQQDGSLSEVCVENADEAAAVVNRPVVASTAVQRSGVVNVR